jgi:hypothetical protein
MSDRERPTSTYKLNGESNFAKICIVLAAVARAKISESRLYETTALSGFSNLDAVLRCSPSGETPCTSLREPVPVIADRGFAARAVLTGLPRRGVFGVSTPQYFLQHVVGSPLVVEDLVYLVLVAP